MLIPAIIEAEHEIRSSKDGLMVGSVRLKNPDMEMEFCVLTAAGHEIKTGSGHACERAETEIKGVRKKNLYSCRE